MIHNLFDLFPALEGELNKAVIHIQTTTREILRCHVAALDALRSISLDIGMGHRVIWQAHNGTWAWLIEAPNHDVAFVEEAPHVLKVAFVSRWTIGQIRQQIEEALGL